MPRWEGSGEEDAEEEAKEEDGERAGGGSGELSVEEAEGGLRKRQRGEYEGEE